VSNYKITVLMCVYDGEDAAYFKLAICSVILQARKADQIVLVVDGQVREELNELISEYEKKSVEIKVVRLAKSVGLAKALNVGLESCEGDLIARMDSDDICTPERLELQEMAFIKNSQLDVCGGYAELIDGNGKVYSYKYVPQTHDDIFNAMYSCPFIHPSVMYKKKSITELGGYNEELARRQDYELWFRCAEAGFEFLNINHVIIQYRLTELTHKKQTKSILLQQARIGLNGVRSLNQENWKKIAVFYPFFRSFLPSVIVHALYKYSKFIDPRFNKL
jgi:glycosyltransferase involved in cell wall biosynthesis